jgi:hypothetical protein
MEKSNGMSVFCSWGFHTFLNKEHAKGIAEFRDTPWKYERKSEEQQNRHEHRADSAVPLIFQNLQRRQCSKAHNSGHSSGSNSNSSSSKTKLKCANLV